MCKLLQPCTRLEKLGLREQESRVSVHTTVRRPSEKKKKHRYRESISKDGNKTSLKVAMASTTSFVKVFPTPEVPMSTVGLIAWFGRMLYKSSTHEEILRWIVLFIYINSSQELLDGLVVMCPWLLEVLKRFLARANNQSLQDHSKGCFVSEPEEEVIANNDVINNTLESTSQIFFRVSSIGVPVYKTIKLQILDKKEQR